MKCPFSEIARELETFGITRFFVDVDGVVLDSRRALADFAQECYPSVPLTLNWKASRGWEFLGIPRETYEEILHDPRQIDLKKPLISGVKEGLALLVAGGFKVDLLSSIAPSMIARRLEHLREDALPFDELLTVPRDASKEEYLKEFAPAIMIDDYKKHVVTADNAGCVGVLFTQPYNEAESGLRLDGWSLKALQTMLTNVLTDLPKLNLPARRIGPQGKKPFALE